MMLDVRLPSDIQRLQIFAEFFFLIRFFFFRNKFDGATLMIGLEPSIQLVPATMIERIHLSRDCRGSLSGALAEVT